MTVTAVSTAENMRRRIALQNALLEFICQSCGARIPPKVEHTEGRVRYVRCIACGSTGKVSIGHF